MEQHIDVSLSKTNTLGGKKKPHNNNKKEIQEKPPPVHDSDRPGYLTLGCASTSLCSSKRLAGFQNSTSYVLLFPGKSWYISSE